MADLQRYQPGYFLAAVHEISIGLKQRSATVTYINLTHVRFIPFTDHPAATPATH